MTYHVGDMIVQPFTDEWAYRDDGRHFIGFHVDERMFSVQWSNGDADIDYGDRTGCPVIIERPDP